MPDTRASMLATLAEIRSKPSTPGRVAAIGRIQDGLAKMSDYAANTPKGGGRARAMKFHDRERLMGIADDSSRSEKERQRAKDILKGNGDISVGDAQFIDRANSKDWFQPREICDEQKRAR